MSNSWIKANIWPCIQPIIYETECPAFPYTTCGTAFLVVYRGRAFAITARHVLFPLNPVCLLPSETSQKLLPFVGVFSVPEDQVSDDFADFAIIEIDMSKIKRDSELGATQAIVLERVVGDWISRAHELNLFICGYPTQHSKIEIDNEAIINPRYMLRGRYSGMSSHSPEMHTISVSDACGVDNFAGFSGSPVFACIPNEQEPTEVVLCGMAVRGTSSSGLIHFVERDILVAGVRVKPAPYRVTRKY